MKQITLFDSMLLGSTTVYFVVCVVGTAMARPGPGNESNWGPAYGMLMAAPYAFVIGAVIGVGLHFLLCNPLEVSERKGCLLTLLGLAGIVLCWIYALFIWG